MNAARHRASVLAATKNERSALANPANCFSPPPFFWPPHFLAKAAKSGLRRKTNGQDFLMVKKPRNIPITNKLQTTISKNVHKKQRFAGLYYESTLICSLLVSDFGFRA